MSDRSTHAARVAKFRALHEDLLVLPNAWDAPSARVIAAAGAHAVATTSAGVAWSRGRADGAPPPHGLDADDALDALARMLLSLEVPLSADLESGYAATPAGVASTVTRAVELGVSGINLEDSRAGVLVSLAEQAEVYAAVAAAVADSGVPIFVNARTDVCLQHDPEMSDDVVAEIVARGRADAAAGGAGVFVPGLADPALVRTVTSAVELPVNLMVGAGPVDLRALADLGVRRVSWGPQPMRAAYGWLGDQVGALLADPAAAGLPAGAASSLLSP